MPKRGAKREYIVVAVRGDAANGWNICDTFGNPSVCRVYNNHEHAAETAAAVAKALNGLVSGHWVAQTRGKVMSGSRDQLSTVLASARQVLADFIRYEEGRCDRGSFEDRIDQLAADISKYREDDTAEMDEFNANLGSHIDGTEGMEA